MEHGSYDVDILDERGTVVGKKQRRDIKKSTDIFTTVHTLMITPRGEVVVSKIKHRDDLPNLFSGRYSSTSATIQRSGESSSEAAKRGVARELFIDNPAFHFVGEDFTKTPEDGRYIATALYYFVGEPPQTFSLTDLSDLNALSPRELDRMADSSPQTLTPALLMFWRKYKTDLPL